VRGKLSSSGSDSYRNRFAHMLVTCCWLLVQNSILSPLRKITSNSHNAAKALIFNLFNYRWLKPTVIEIQQFAGL
jgi:hypothetical protein